MRLSFTRLPALLAFSVLVFSSPAPAADGLSANKAGLGNDSRATARATTTGWVYGKCANVVTTVVGSGLLVKVTNTDGNWASAASKTAQPTVGQLTLLRACRQSGAYWGFYLSNGYWSAAVSF